MAKPANKAERAHFAKVAQMPCVACGAWPIEVHHVIGWFDRMGRAPKRHDRVVPMCAACHREVHAVSHKNFPIDLMAIAERLANG